MSQQAKSKKKCQRTGCTGEAEWIPILCSTNDGENWAKTALLDLPICDFHKEHLVLGDYLTRAAFAMIKRWCLGDPVDYFHHMEFREP